MTVNALKKYGSIISGIFQKFPLKRVRLGGTSPVTISLTELSFVSLSYTSAMGYIFKILEETLKNIFQISIRFK
jgi:hypothetical protein